MSTQYASPSLSHSYFGQHCLCRLLSRTLTVTICLWPTAGRPVLQLFSA